MIKVSEGEVIGDHQHNRHMRRPIGAGQISVSLDFQSDPIQSNPVQSVSQSVQSSSSAQPASPFFIQRAHMYNLLSPP